MTGRRRPAPQRENARDRGANRRERLVDEIAALNSASLNSNPLQLRKPSPTAPSPTALKVDHRTIDRDRGENAPPDAQKAQQNGGGALGRNSPTRRWRRQAGHCGKSRRRQQEEAKKGKRKKGAAKAAGAGGLEHERRSGQRSQRKFVDLSDQLEATAGRDRQGGFSTARETILSALRQRGDPAERGGSRSRSRSRRSRRPNHLEMAKQAESKSWRCSRSGLTGWPKSRPR